MTIQWLRRWIRRSSKPIPHHVADVWKRRLSIAYGILAWNAIAMVGYAAYKGKRDWAAYHGLEVEQGSPSQQFSRMMDIPKAKVIRISGFQASEKFEIDNTEMFDNVKDEELK